MNNSQCVVLHFDYGGYYSKSRVDESLQWMSKNDSVSTIVMKTSIEDLSYSGLVDRICKKVVVDQAITKVKISYFPLVAEPKRPSYILDDEDMFGYLMEINKDQCRSLLHVELIKDVEENQNLEYFSSGRVDSRVENVITTHSSDHVEVTPAAQETHYLNDGWDDGMNMALGQEFESKQEVQDLVEKASHENCFEIVVDKSTTKLYLVKCHQLNEGCKWFLRVAKIKDSEKFSVRTYNNRHTCSRATASTSKKRRKGTPQLVASVLNEDYPGKFNTPSPKDLISMVQGRFGTKVSYSTALRGKKKAFNDVRGNPEESYSKLYSYLYMLEKMNHGTKTSVELDDNQRFKYLFIALGACIEGFKAVRKVIIVDGTFLKTAHRGVLIVATAQDPDHHHYPIAFGVVDGEKDASWMWFLNNLKTIIPDDPELVFVSNRNTSIIKAIGEVYQKSHHGYCIWHLSQNVKSQVHYTKKVNKESVAEKFRKCAKVYTEGEFNKLYGEFREMYPTTGEYLDRSVDVRKWARCYFPGEKYNIDTTNCAESINSVFKDARKYSLLPMLDAILGKLDEWFNKHRKSSAEAPIAQILVPYVESEMHTRCKDAKLLPVQEINNYKLEYNVMGRDRKSYLVDLTRRRCTCRYFDIVRYPCVHAIAAAASVSNKEIQVHELCSKYYFIEKWALAYYRTIYLVPHKSEWNVPDNIREFNILPPEYTKQRGRLQEARIPSFGEHGRRKENKKNTNQV